MTRIYEPKIDIPNGAVAPDSYNESYGLVPPDDFVVSRNRDGSVASRYGDLSWDRSPYDPNERTSWLRFPYWQNISLTPIREQLNRESRFIMFLLIWKTNCHPLSYSTLSNYLSMLRLLAKYSESNNCCIKDVLADQSRLFRFIESGVPSYVSPNLVALLTILLRLGPEQTGFNVSGIIAIRKLQKIATEYKKTVKQHPPIPTRIYSEIICRITSELAEFECIADRYLFLVSKCSGDQFYGRSKSQQLRVATKQGQDKHKYRPSFAGLLKEYDLLDYFSVKKLPFSVQGMSKGLAAIQMVAKLCIQAYSGMRDDEANLLPYQCINKSVSNGKTHYILSGITTKLNMGMPKKTQWITSSEGYRAVIIVQKIADTIYDVTGRCLQTTYPHGDYPLFISTVNLPLTSFDCETVNSKPLSTGLKINTFIDLMTRLQPTIEDRDLCELEQIDPHRAWRAEAKFQVGQPWVFATHQFRRSLALYAQRSGLVSLPSLRRQLQHITEEMSRYYARGSSFAKDFMGDEKEHFGLEWQHTQPVSEALSYIANVLLSDDVLFGGHGDWVKNRLSAPGGAMMFDRDATIRSFRKGEFSYRETSLGGCINTGECKQTAIKWLDIDCISGCQNMVGKTIPPFWSLPMIIVW